MNPNHVAMMPHWPARMGEDLAALYLAVSVSKFREGVKARTYPQPVRDGGRVLWAKRQLDLYVDSQFGISDGEDATWADYK